MLRRFGSFIAAALVVASCSLAKAETAADWEWNFAPYLWGPSASLDVTVHNDPVISADASFQDLLHKTDFAGSFHFEGQCQHAGFFVDVMWLNLGADQTSSARPPLPGGTQTTVDVNIGLYEAAGFYRVAGKARGLDLIFGARMFDYRSRLDATIPPPVNAKISRGTDKNFIDAFGGVRYLTPIGKRWDFLIRGDVGTGETDLSWNALASFGVRLGKTDLYNLRFGWHHMELDVSDDDNPLHVETESNLTLTGPFFAFAMKF
jgi:hypothetical protein